MSTTTTTQTVNPTGLAKSRYGATPAVKFVAAQVEGVIATPEAVPGEVARLRDNFNKDKTLSYEWRVGQLHALLRMLEEGEKELQDGLFKDLHKSPFESNFTEIDLVKQEAHYALEHLAEWMSPQGRYISPMNQPGKGEICFDPLGVVLIMGAWNYPAQLTLAPIVGAIAAGNCVVVKPGSYAPETSHAMAKLILKYMDRDCFAVVEGDRHCTDALLKQRFDLIFFTGSGFVGKIVAKAAAEHLTPVVLELGGKSPCIVDKSANVELAASRMVWGTFLNSGQTCIRPDHCLVHEDVADQFIKTCKEKIAEFYGRDAQQTEFYGRIINHNAFDRLAGIIDACKANLVEGGRVDRTDKFIQPTLLDYGTDYNAFSSSAGMQDELFGPIVPICRFKTLESVIQHVRKLPTGKPLALYLFADDSKVIDEVTRRTTAGGMAVNDCLVHIINHETPFGGVGPSGMGSYHGHQSFLTFSHQKSKTSKWSAIDSAPGVKQLLGVRFPPYTPTKQSLVKFLGNPTLAWAFGQFEKPLIQRIIALFFLWTGFRAMGYQIVRVDSRL